MSARDAIGRTFGGWLLVDLLGQGGMGAVYRARNAQLGCEGAFKLVPATLASPNAVPRLKRETELLARLSHPGIVRVLGSGALPDGRPYYVMEVVEGRGLDFLIENEGAFEPRRAATLVEKVARALGHAHAQAIVHRDLKPSNVIVRADGSPVILDFGLAKAIFEDETERLSKTGQLLGTVHYMSPEQAAGRASSGIGPPSDVFSLGVVLYELLAGRRPFQGATAMELLARIESGLITPPGDVVRGIPAPLEAIVWKALAHEPEKRYADGEALARDLDRFLRGKSVEAPPLRGLARRTRIALASSALVAVAAAIAVALLLGKEAAPSSPVPSVAAFDLRGGLASLRTRSHDLAAKSRAFAKGARASAPPATQLTELVASEEARAAKLPAGSPARTDHGRALAEAHATLAALRIADGAPPAEIEAELAAATADLAGAAEPPLLCAARGAFAAAGKRSEAAGELERALAAGGPEREAILDLFPSPRLEEALAETYVATDRAGEAVPLLDRALSRIRAEDRAAQARLRLLRARAHLARGDLEAAIADAEAGEAASVPRDAKPRREPAFARAYLERGRAQLEAGQLAKAARAFHEACLRDESVFSPELARGAAATLERVAIDNLRSATQSTVPSERPTAAFVKEQHAYLDMASALDLERDRAPAELVSLEKVMAQSAEPNAAVRFVIAARFRRLKVKFDPVVELHLFLGSEGRWGRAEQDLRDYLALHPGDENELAEAYGRFSVEVRPAVPEVAFEAEEEWRATFPTAKPLLWSRTRAFTLVALHRNDEALHVLDESVDVMRSKDGLLDLKEALFWRGTFLKDRERWAEGARDLQEAIAILAKMGETSTMGHPWYDLAACLHGLKRDAEALAALEAARKRGGVDEEASLTPLETAIREALDRASKR